MRSFAKIKSSRKFLNLQYSYHWLLQCTGSCGVGIRTRQVKCTRPNKFRKMKVTGDSHCKHIPNTTLPLVDSCKLEPCQVSGPNWYASPWSKVWYSFSSEFSSMQSIIYSRRHELICIKLFFYSLPASNLFCCLLIIFVNSLDPDQTQQNFTPDLDPNYLTL